MIGDEGISVTDLPAAARVSRRAVQASLVLSRRGWLEVDATKVVRLTDSGRRVRDEYGERVAERERTWSADIRGSDELRDALAALVGRLDLELPHYPITYGSADPRATGGNARPAKAGPPRIPAHGTDWAPVLRANSDGVGPAGVGEREEADPGDQAGERGARAGETRRQPPAAALGCLRDL